jgi:MATE family multidrug resistance protein
VSNEIGAGNIDRAKNAVAVTLKLSVFLALSFLLVLGFGHGLWASLFSGSAVIAAEFAAITPFMMMSIVLDSAQGVLSGEKIPSHPARTISYHGHEIRDKNALLW